MAERPILIEMKNPNKTQKTSVQGEIWRWKYRQNRKGYYGYPKREPGRLAPNWNLCLQEIPRDDAPKPDAAKASIFAP